MTLFYFSLFGSVLSLFSLIFNWFLLVFSLFNFNSFFKSSLSIPIRQYNVEPGSPLYYMQLCSKMLISGYYPVILINYSVKIKRNRVMATLTLSVKLLNHQLLHEAAPTPMMNTTAKPASPLFFIDQVEVSGNNRTDNP